jgi:hypothetical protein
VTGLTGNAGYDFTRAFATTAMNLTVVTEGVVAAPPFAANPVSGFDHWIQEQAVLGGGVDRRGRAEDPDGDGTVNLLEYAFGTSPFRAGPALQPKASIRQEGGLDWAVLEFPRRTDTSTLLYEVLASGDLDDWRPVEDLLEFERLPVPGQPTVEMVKVAVWPALQKGEARFLRVRVREVLPGLLQALPPLGAPAAPKP